MNNQNQNNNQQNNQNNSQNKNQQNSQNRQNNNSQNQNNNQNSQNRQNRQYNFYVPRSNIRPAPPSADCGAVSLPRDQTGVRSTSVSEEEAAFSMVGSACSIWSRKRASTTGSSLPEIDTDSVSVRTTAGK